MDDYIWKEENSNIKEKNITNEKLSDEEIKLVKYCSDTELEIKEYLKEITEYLINEEN